MTIEFDLTDREKRALEFNLTRIRATPGAEVPGSGEEFVERWLRAQFTQLMTQIEQQYLIELGAKADEQDSLNAVARAIDQATASP